MTTLERTTGELLRRLGPQVLTALARRNDEFDACEDAVQEALLAAALQWPREGVPENPSAWLLTVAGRRLTDDVRRQRARRGREDAVAAGEPAHLAVVPAPDESSEGAAADDTLKLLFLCCHPALTTASQIALTLRAVGGLTTAQIASAFLVPEATMAQRISRGKQRIKAAGARFELPANGAYGERLRAVLHALYLIFNEGYTASSGAALQRTELTAEAIRLGRLLHRLLPENGEVTGLLALMLLTDAHREARTDDHGALIPLAEQDRSEWNRTAIGEGIELVSSALAASPLGPFQIQAAIAAVHGEATSTKTTDWPQIVALYRLLAHLAPNPMITINQAAAVAMVDGPAAGLALLATLGEDERVASHHRLTAVRGHLLEMAGELTGAREAYQRAARQTTSLPEQRYLQGRAAALAPLPNGGTDMESTTETNRRSALTATLQVPGATLYYEVRGSGPLLLLICGGVYDADGYAPLVEMLTDRYTVATYDRRGNSRSPLDEPPGPQQIEIHADDAHRLLSELGAGEDAPAYVFGNSSGAAIGLELAIRHPGEVRMLVAHEPQIFDLLPEREHWHAVVGRVEQAFATGGAGAAMQTLGAELQMGNEADSDGERIPGGAEAPGPEPDARTLEMLARFQKNMEFFIGYEVPSFDRYTPKIGALRELSTRIVAAAGQKSEGEPPHRVAIVLAERLGSEPVYFPGDHGGFGLHVEAFAAQLTAVLSER